MLSSSCRRFACSILAFTLACVVTLCPAASAQDGQDFPAPDTPTFDIIAPTDSEPLSSSGCSADCGFWFLSTHHSPQSFKRSCPQFCPDTCRYEQCAGYRASTFAELCGSLEPGVPVCIVIHGSFVDRDSACHEAKLIWKWLRCASCGDRMQMIYMSWPSYRPYTPLVAIDANKLGRQAARNGHYLAELVARLPCDSPVCMLGHSHGTRVIAAGLHLLSGGAIQGMRHPWARHNGRPLRTVFCASAIDHDWLRPGQRYDRALCSTQCLLNFRNHYDPALKVYTLRLPLIARRPLGLSGLSGSDRRRMGAFGRRVLDYDVSQAVGRAHQWPNYYSNVGLAMAMRNYVYFPDHVATPVVRVTEVKSPDVQ